VFGSLLVNVRCGSSSSLLSVRFNDNERTAMTKYILGIDVACRAAHQGTLTNERGEFLWSARKFRTTPSDLTSLWSS
jgi:hypothetical protein